MKASTFVARTLLIRDNEQQLVKRLFAFEFFQGISIAVFFYCSFTIFLTHLPTENLAYAFVLSAFLLWIFGALYSKLEHQLGMRKLILMVVFINAAIILAFRFGLMLEEPIWFYYLMLGGFNIAYLLNNLEFWGSASLMFDVRQSKRLFSIISAGDIPAKFVGYVSTAFLGKILGEENLLWIAFGSLVISLYFYRLLADTGALDIHHHKKHEDLHMNPTADSAIRLIRKNALIRQAALISFFSYSAFLLLLFLFFGYIKKSSVGHDETFTLYLAIFLAGSRLITLIVKLAVTNRLADNMGLRNSLLITPIIMFVLCLFALPASMNSSITTIFYVFATITIVIDVLRAAIQSPVLLAAMQPLPVHERLSGHTIIKGITDPFAFFFIGCMLSVIFIFRDDVDYRFMSVILFVLVIGWIVSVLRFGKIYSATLQHAIRTRSIQEREISISDRESLQILLEKIATGEPGEAILALRLAKDQPADVQRQILVSGLKHSSPYVQRDTILLAREWKVSSIIPDLKELTATGTDHKVLAATITALAALDDSFDYAQFLDHSNPDVVLATIVHSLHRNDVSSAKASEILQSWAHSGDALFRLRASTILGQVHVTSLYPLLISLMHDPDPGVIASAIASAGHLKDASLINELINLIHDSHKQSKIIDALQSAGAHAVEPVAHFIMTSTDELLQKKMIMLLGRISDASAYSALDRMTDELPLFKDSLFKAMHHRGFKADAALKNKYQRFIRDYLDSAVHLSYITHFLQQHNSDNSLIHALETELLSLREKLLYLFSFLYDQESIKKVTGGFDLGTRESISNGLEIISVSVSREFARDFICIYEPTAFEQKCSLLNVDHDEPHLTKALIVDEVLRDQRHQYHAWTKACVMYFMKNEIKQVERKTVEPFRFSANPLLKQTAEWLLKSTSLATG